MTEEELEDLLWEQPWLLSLDLEPVEDLEPFRGDGGRVGRQIRLYSLGTQRRVDLLLRTRRERRPVIVELKRGHLGRQDLAQILEYGGALRALPLDERGLWHQAFDKRLLDYPRLILVGTGAEAAMRAAAQLAGVELVILNDDVTEVSLDSLRSDMEEYRAIIGSGERPGLQKRYELCEDVLGVLEEAVGEVDGARLGPDWSSSSAWWDSAVPFVEATVQLGSDRGWHFGVFEFQPDDPDLRFNERVFWVSLTDGLDPTDENGKARVEAISTEHGEPVARWTAWGDSVWPVYELQKILYLDSPMLKKRFVTLLTLGIELIAEDE